MENTNKTRSLQMKIPFAYIRTTKVHTQKKPQNIDKYQKCLTINLLLIPNPNMGVIPHFISLHAPNDRT